MIRRRFFTALAAASLVLVSATIPTAAFAAKHGPESVDISIVAQNRLWGSGQMAMIGDSSYLLESTATKIISRLLGDHVVTNGPNLHIMSPNAVRSTSMTISRAEDKVYINNGLASTYIKKVVDGQVYMPFTTFQSVIARLGALSGLQHNILTILTGLPFSSASRFYSSLGNQNVVDAQAFPSLARPQFLAIPYLSGTGVLHVAVASKSGPLHDIVTSAHTYDFTVPVEWHGGGALWIAGNTAGQAFDMSLVGAASSLGEFQGSYGVSFYVLNGDLKVVSSDQGRTVVTGDKRTNTELSGRIYTFVGTKLKGSTSFDSTEPYVMRTNQVDPSWLAYSVIYSMIQNSNTKSLQGYLASHFPTARGFYGDLATRATSLRSFLADEFSVLSLRSSQATENRKIFQVMEGNGTLTVTIAHQSSGWVLTKLHFS